MSDRSGTIGRAVVMQSVVRVFSLVASVLTVSLSTRYLGVENYGLLTAAVVFIGLFESFTELGMGAVIVRRVANGKGPLGHLIGINLGFSLLFAPLVAVAAVVVGLIVYRDDPVLILAVGIIAAGLFLNTISTCYDPVYEVHIRFGAVAVIDGLSRLGTLTGTFVVATMDLGLLPMVAVQIIPMVVRLVVTLITGPRMEPSRPIFDRVALWSLIRESLPFSYMLLVAGLYWRLDGLLLAVLSTPVETGAYGIALQITAAFGFISTIFCRAVYSTTAESYAENRERFARVVRSSYQFMLLASAPIGIFGALVASRAIGLLATPEFVEQATTVTQLFFLATTFSFLNALTTQPLFAAGDQGFLVKLSTLNLGLNVVLNLVLVPGLGAVGTGVAMLTTELSGTIAAAARLWWLGTPVLAFHFVLRLVPPLALGVGAIWLTWPLPIGVVALVTAAVYGGATLLTGAVSIDLLKKLIGRGGDDDPGDGEGAEPEGGFGGDDTPTALIRAVAPTAADEGRSSRRPDGSPVSFWFGAPGNGYDSGMTMPIPVFRSSGSPPSPTRGGRQHDASGPLPSPAPLPRGPSLAQPTCRIEPARPRTPSPRPRRHDNN